MTGHTKSRREAPPGFFAVEAAGLDWLRVPGGVPVARVLGVTADSITVEQVIQGVATAELAAAFGRGLVSTHDAGASAFGVGPHGWAGDGYIGDLPLTLQPEPAWGPFYAGQRVLPYARQAHRLGSLDEPGLALIERLGERILAGDFDDPAPPARIHGDLWAGNVLFGTESVTLIDPAAHGGHRITDLAMLALFGLPHLGVVLDAYVAASSHLPSDWRELVGLHQLHPLLVHAVLFGGGYGEQAVMVARKY